MLLRLPMKHFLSSIPREGDGAGGGGAGGGQGGDGTGAGGQAGGGQQQAPWYESPDLGLDDDIKTHIAGKNFPDIKTALRSGLEADTLARSRNVLPAFDPEKAADWPGWEKLGWQKDPAKYDVAKPEVKQGQHLDEAMFDTFKKLAHEHRVPAGAAKGMFDGMFSFIHDRLAEMDAGGAKSAEDMDRELDQAWGADAGRNRDLAKRAMQTFGIGADDAAELEKVTGAARLVKMFHDIGSKLGEEQLLPGNGGGGGSAHQSAAGVRAEMNRLKADPKFVASLKDARDPLHADNTAKWQRLNKDLAKFEPL